MKTTTSRARGLRWPIVGLVVGLVVSSVADASEPEVLARVDGEPVTTKDLEELLGTQQWPEDVTVRPELVSDDLIRRLVQNRLLEQEGRRVGLHEKPEIRGQVWDLKRHRGMMALLDSISAEARRTVPDELDPVLATPNVIQRVSQILVANEAEARRILQRLEDGADFAEVAELHSRDTTSVVAPGGDFGWNRKDRYVPEFAAALHGLEVGELAEPFQTERGWHILRLTDQRTETVGQSDAMETAVLERARTQRVMEAIREYIDSLLRIHHVAIDSSRLASLDYQSEDPDVMEVLRTSDGVLATLPWRDLTVSDLTKEIRFQHFHGIQGKPDANQIRDSVFDEWITELLLRHEASRIGLDARPEVVAEADRLERRLIREEMLGRLLDVRFDPSDADVASYYEENRSAFTPTPRIRVQGVLLSDEGAAHGFRAKLGQGVQIGWLADRTPEVVDQKPEILSGWIDPGTLGLDPTEAAPGALVGPIALPDGWTVARITDLETPDPLPLAQCRDQVLRRMKADKRLQAVRSAVDRLEAEAEIEIASGAPGIVTAHIESLFGRASRDR